MDNKIQGLPLALESLGIGHKQPKKDTSLGQDAFMKLMIAQLKNQDPINPMDNANFLQQLAQFSTVSGINSLQSSFSTLATSLQSNQALQASTLVGRSVLVPGTVATVSSGGGIEGAVDLPQSSGGLVVNIYDATGQVVRRINLGAQQAGLVHFNWDGHNEGGQPVPPGRYKLSAEGAADGANVSYDTLIRARVESVSLSRDGGNPQLNLASLGPVGLEQVREVI